MGGERMLPKESQEFPMITYDEAMTAREFHRNCTETIGPRGGCTVKTEVWRRNGRTKTWKRSPGKFQIPVKYGLRAYDYITEEYADQFVTRANCPVCGER
jgi:hypothetical protein